MRNVAPGSEEHLKKGLVFLARGDLVSARRSLSAFGSLICMFIFSFHKYS